MVLLNADVVEHILDSYDHWWPRDFCRLILVSSAWLEPARKRLYAFPHLSSYRSCHLLARTLRENRDIVPLVRGLDTRPESPPSWSHDLEGKHLRGICPGVLRLLALVHLERLTLGGDLAFSAHQYLRMIGSPQALKSLNIICSPSRGLLLAPKQAFLWDGEFALRFHALQTLTLDGLLLDVDDMHYDPESDEEQETKRAARGCALKELHFRGIDFTDHSGRLCALLHGPSSWRQLRAFTFTTQHCSARHLDHFLSVLSCAYDSLEYLFFHGGASDPFDLVNTTPLPRLRTLKTSHQILTFAISSTLPSVEEVETIGRLLPFHIDDLTDAISRKSLPKLRSLVVNLSECGSRDVIRLHSALMSLVETCEEHGVKHEILFP